MWWVDDEHEKAPVGSNESHDAQQERKRSPLPLNRVWVGIVCCAVNAFLFVWPVTMILVAVFENLEFHSSAESETEDNPAVHRQFKGLALTALGIIIASNWSHACLLTWYLLCWRIWKFAELRLLLMWTILVFFWMLTCNVLMLLVLIPMFAGAAFVMVLFVLVFSSVLLALTLLAQLLALIWCSRRVWLLLRHGVAKKDGKSIGLLSHKEGEVHIATGSSVDSTAASELQLVLEESINETETGVYLRHNDNQNDRQLS